MAQTPKNLRSRKGSLKDPSEPSVPDFAALLKETEERMKSFFREEIKSIYDRISTIETSVLSLKTETVRLDSEIQSIQDVILRQQITIESFESKQREKNVIIHNIPESGVDDGVNRVKEDTDKVALLCQIAKVDIKSTDISSIHRLGGQNENNGKGPRPIKVQLKTRDEKYKLLNKRREISTNDVIIKTFGRKIYVNPDQSYLIQKEELRLRRERARLKNKFPNSSVFIRSGVLYMDNSPFDKVDVSKQLF